MFKMTQHRWLRVIVQRFRVAQQGFVARREARIRVVTARRELSSFSERELHDVGLSRGDIERVVRETTPMQSEISS